MNGALRATWDPAVRAATSQVLAEFHALLVAVDTNVVKPGNDPEVAAAVLAAALAEFHAFVDPTLALAWVSGAQRSLLVRTPEPLPSPPAQEAR